MLNEFKKFILKGNVIDLATGVIIGAAFTTIVKSFTAGVVEPILACFGGGPSPKLTIPLKNEMVEVTKTVDGKEVTEMVNKLIEIDIGSIIGATSNFLITAAVVFFVIIKPANKLMELTSKKEEEKPAEPPPVPEDIKLLTEIRDALKK